MPGQIYAEKLVGAFGEAVLEVIEAAPERLREVAGIGAKRAASVEKAWAEQKAIREIMLFLHSARPGRCGHSSRDSPDGWLLGADDAS
jgi:NAD-dependent DNA ligase